MTIPWSTIATISIKNSRFDKALVIETFNKNINDTAAVDGYTLGFRLDNQDILEDTNLQVNKLLKTFRNSPVLGIDRESDQEFSKLVVDSKVREGFIGHVKNQKNQKSSEKSSDKSGLEQSLSSVSLKSELENDDHSDYIDNTVKAKNYETSHQNEEDQGEVKYFYCEELGVAVQELRPGQALSSLWSFDLPEVECEF